MRGMAPTGLSKSVCLALAEQIYEWAVKQVELTGFEQARDSLKHVGKVNTHQRKKQGAVW